MAGFRNPQWPVFDQIQPVPERRTREIKGLPAARGCPIDLDGYEGAGHELVIKVQTSILSRRSLTVNRATGISHRMSKQAPLDLYLDEIAKVKATKAGTKETSYYPAVAITLNAVGQKLKPSVYCLHHPSGKEGIPDFGLFEQTKFKKGEQPSWEEGILPERGVVEVKGASHLIKTLLASKQITEKYLPAYQLLLATNLWQWRLVTSHGVVEMFDIGNDEKALWKLVDGARPDTVRTRFKDFLERCLLTAAPLTKPSDLAFFLASLCTRCVGAPDRASRFARACRISKGYRRCYRYSLRRR
jgi:hypothetical protein